MSAIEELVAFQGRAPGTDAERRAARYLEERLRKLGRDAEVEPLSIHPNYAVTHALHALIAIVGSVLSVTVPAAGAALVLVAAISTFGDLSGGFYLLRRLTGRRASQNVTSREGGDKPGVIVLTAHYDAGRGSGALKHWPVFTLLFWAMFAILACSLIRVAGFEGTPLTIIQFIPTVVLIACVPLLIDVPLSPVGGGANDNASGVATVLRLAERYGGRLEHFDVWVVLPGAGEGLMLGMRNWIKEHKGELDPASTIFLGVDVAASSTVRWITKEGHVLPSRYHPELIRLCEEVGEGRPMAARGASDALMARAAGFPAITITSRTTRGQRAERVDPDALERTYDFCAALIELVDAEVGPQLS